MEKRFSLFVFSSCLMLLTCGFHLVLADSVEFTSSAEVKFGEMKTLLYTNDSVFHIEPDLGDSRQLLYSEKSALKLTDGNVSSLIVGSVAEKGYKEGVGEAARFDHITGFTQVNATHVVVVDSYNYCLRWVNRLTRTTSPLVGLCKSYGNSDGLNARFNLPYSVIKDQKSAHQLIVTEIENNAVRRVNIVTRKTTTLIKSGLKKPKGITYDKKEENLLVSNDHYICEFNLKHQNITNITGGKSIGFSDGRLSTAGFYSPKEIISLTDSLVLVADTIINRVRVVDRDRDGDRVTSVCTGVCNSADGSAQSCGLNYPFSLHTADNQIYIGERGAIRTLSYTVSTPPRKRLDFLARYNMKCSVFDSSIQNLLLESISSALLTEIEEICSGECKRSQDHGVTLSCFSDVTSITWPTDLYFPGDMTEIPDSFKSKLTPKLMNKLYLRIILYKHIPAIVYPLVTEDSLFAELVLTPVCYDGTWFDSTTNTCTNILN